MSYENFIHHRDLSNSRSMAKAQAAHDAQTPPDGDSCGEVGHDWHRLPGEAKNGTRFMKCRRCGAEEEV